MPENQDGDKNQMSLAKASVMSWALKSIWSPTGSEWKWYKRAEVCQAWSRLGWPLNKGGSYRLTLRHTGRNQELQVLGNQWLYTSRVLLLVAPQGKGVISGGPYMILFKRGHIIVRIWTSSEGWQSLQVVLTAKIRLIFPNLKEITKS